MLYIYIYTYIYIYIVCCYPGRFHHNLDHAFIDHLFCDYPTYQENITEYVKYIQYVNNYWTSCCSPIGLDESSGRIWTTVMHGFVFRVYLMFLKINQNINMNIFDEH